MDKLRRSRHLSTGDRLSLCDGLTQSHPDCCRAAANPLLALGKGRGPQCGQQAVHLAILGQNLNLVEDIITMTNVVIASAARTAVGSFGGSFANTPAHDLGAAVLEAVVERAGVDKGEVSETILGQVLTAAQGQNPARQAMIKLPGK